jgi:hypothetical protein
LVSAVHSEDIFLSTKNHCPDKPRRGKLWCGETLVAIALTSTNKENLMKNPNLFSACVLIAQAFFITAAYSQISITSSDYQKDLAVSITTVRYGSPDTSGLAAVLSASGANKTWILTGRTFTPSETTTEDLLNKSSSGAPGQGNSAFSSANYVVRRRSASKPLFTDWTYLSLTTSGLSFCGYAQDSVGILKSLQTNVPAERVRTYPTTYLSSWTWSSTVTSTTYGGSGGVGVGVNMAGSDVVDAYGTVTTPEGSFPCLRIKRKTDIMFGFFTITSYSYDFVDQNRTIASIDAGSTGNVPGGVSYYKRESTTDVSEDHELMPNVAQLLQNYPNPCNPTTTISYLLSANSFVSLKIYDVLGNEMGVLVNDLKPAGRHTAILNAQNLASGVYFYRLQAGTFVETKKLLLLR